MAARKNYRLKLKYAAQLRHLSELNTEEVRNIKELVMASAPEQISQSPVRTPPEPMANFNFTNPTNSLPSQHLLSHPTALVTSMTTQRRRKASKNGVSSLKRSASTPNVRGDAGLSMADKRRNKLGYHRTSVACGESSSCLRIEMWSDKEAQDIVEGARSDACLPQTMPNTVAPTAFD